jgi:deoxyribodipyrimidine photo-lyase
MKICVVWLKRDLRLTDHAPLEAATRSGLPVLLLYCFEPHILAAKDSDIRHVLFCTESLIDIQKRLLEPCLLVSRREAIESFEIVLEYFEISQIYAHQEVGNQLSFLRDKAMKNWAKQRCIGYCEFGQNGTIRGRKHRQGWQEQLHSEYFESKPIENRPFVGVCVPESLQARLNPIGLPEVKNRFQPGGESFAKRYLDSFLSERHKIYNRTLSKPQAARKGCSRLSPYLAFGCLSARQVYQAANRAGSQSFNLKNFLSRIWWRSHYIQKLESDYRLEDHPINPAFEKLNRAKDGLHLELWQQGKTGFPMVDASMRCLQATGWLNFRMRAMLVTFASFGLWLDFRPLAWHLAKLFLDYDPGIHFPQIQMQAGLTGYHVLRIFNPSQQILKYDTNGEFIKTWLPELSKVPTGCLTEPWKMSALEQTFYGCKIGQDYPAPIVNYQQALTTNRNRYWQLRQSTEAKSFLPEIWQKFCLPEDVKKYLKQEDGCRFEME